MKLPWYMKSEDGINIRIRFIYLLFLYLKLKIKNVFICHGNRSG